MTDESLQESRRRANEAIVGKELAALLHDDGTPWYRKRSLLLLNLLLLVPLLSSSTSGYDGAMMNAIQTVPQWRTYLDNPSGEVIGIINAIFPVGKICGVAPATFLGDRYGRRIPLLVGLFVAIAGATIQGASINRGMFIFSRWLLGFGTACVHQPSPVLISELAYPLHRGKITSLYQTFYYFGAIFAAWLTFGTVDYESNWSWRIPSILQAGVPVVQLALFWLVPESPRWLIANGQKEKARQVLVKYHGDGDDNSPLVAFEIAEIENGLAYEAETKASSFRFKELIATGPNRWRTFIAVTLGAFANWNGSGVISYYLTLVLNTIGITRAFDQALINGLLQVFNFFISVFVGAMMVDRLGRRTLFLWASIGCALSYIIFTILNARVVETHDSAIGVGVVVMIFVYYFHYDIAFTPLLQAYTVEIFPYSLRGSGVTALYLSNWITLFFNLFVNPIAMAAISWRYYIVYCVIDVVIIVVIYFYYPETKGHTLEEIMMVFDKDVKPQPNEALKMDTELELKEKDDDRVE